MRIGGRRKSVVFFLTFGICLVVLALALNVGWILLNWREVALLVLGIIFFGLIIAGLVLNTTFLVREIRRNEQHDAFINAVTHELKTPLASMRLYLKTLKSREVSEGRRREFYDIMLADGDRLLHTVEQVLHAGRTAQKKRALNLSHVDLGGLVRECLEVARVDERMMAVRVKDSGIGIHRNQLKRIFKRFYRVPGHFMARFKGTGLGLFIVHSIVERHGGRVYAESEGLGRGSTFTIRLPRAEKLLAPSLSSK